MEHYLVECNDFIRKEGIRLERKSVIIICLIFLFGVVSLYKPDDTPTASKSVKDLSVQWSSVQLEGTQVKIKWPSSTIVVKDALASKDTLFNANIEDMTLGFRGYVQVLKIHNVRNIIQQLREGRELDYLKFKESALDIKGYKGFSVAWTAQLEGDMYVSGQEFYILKDIEQREWVRLSIFVDKKEIPNNIDRVAQHILYSIQ